MLAIHLHFLFQWKKNKPPCRFTNSDERTAIYIQKAYARGVLGKSQKTTFSITVYSQARANSRAKLKRSGKMPRKWRTWKNDASYIVSQLLTSFVILTNLKINYLSINHSHTCNFSHSLFFYDNRFYLTRYLKHEFNLCFPNQ